MDRKIIYKYIYLHRIVRPLGLIRPNCAPGRCDGSKNTVQNTVQNPHQGKNGTGRNLVQFIAGPGYRFGNEQLALSLNLAGEVRLPYNIWGSSPYRKRPAVDASLTSDVTVRF